ncbi:uncharacterized protein LOC121383216 [Gigantopelta aegis]|uniref:uncharacterized protein LOC121383216 n=1 Tax=Gigantopelta aegis TaxID=1735272 RepID=UPI001B889330|nr:uncharacterized protein LOC121383216 [Gigantopelta aegis]
MEGSWVKSSCPEEHHHRWKRSLGIIATVVRIVNGIVGIVQEGVKIYCKFFCRGYTGEEYRPPQFTSCGGPASPMKTLRGERVVVMWPKPVYQAGSAGGPKLMLVSTSGDSGKLFKAGYYTITYHLVDNQGYKDSCSFSFQVKIKTMIETLKMEAELYYYYGNCSDPSTQAEIKQKFALVLDDSVLWTDGCPCTVENITVICGEDRRRRDVNIREDKFEKRSTVSTAIITWFWVVPVQNSSVTADEQLIARAERMFSLVQNNQMDIGVAGFEVRPGSFGYDESDPVSPGYLGKYSTGRCYACPTGTMYSMMADKCVRCPLGTSSVSRVLLA